MVLSWRSVGTGLLAACPAFLVAFFVNPVHLGAMGVILLTLSGLVGFLASMTLGKKLSRHDSDQRTAVMVFAFLFFVGIYAPITAIWANAPFYSWSIILKGKPKSEFLAPMVAVALEKTAVSTYGGMFVLLGITFAFSRWSEKKTQSNGHNETSTASRLGWVDIALAVFALLQSFICAFMIFNIAMNCVNVFALFCLAFLQCFLFRSLRLQGQSLWKRPPKIGAKHLSKAVGTILILCLMLCFLAGFLLFVSALGRENVVLSGKARLLSACAVISLLPIVVYQLIVRNHSEIGDEQVASASHFAVRCGFWALLGTFLIIGGLVLRGLAQKEFNSAPYAFDSPFAYAVIALEPLCPSGAFLFLVAVFGGFFVALVLPHSTILARHRIIASAQGGAVGGAVFFSLLIVFALSLAVCTVPCIPVSQPLRQIDMHFTQLLLSDGKWLLLGGFYVVTAFCCAVWFASIWAVEAMFA